MQDTIEEAYRIISIFRSKNNLDILRLIAKKPTQQKAIVKKLKLSAYTVCMAIKDLESIKAVKVDRENKKLITANEKKVERYIDTFVFLSNVKKAKV